MEEIQKSGKEECVDDEGRRGERRADVLNGPNSWLRYVSSPHKVQYNPQVPVRSNGLRMGGKEVNIEGYPFSRS